MSNHDWHFAAEKLPPEDTRLLLVAKDGQLPGLFQNNAYFLYHPSGLKTPIRPQDVILWRLYPPYPSIDGLHKEAAKDRPSWMTDGAPMGFERHLTSQRLWHACNAHLERFAPICPNCSGDVPLSNGFPSRLAPGTMACGSCGHTLTETAPNGLLVQFNVLLKHKSNEDYERTFR